MLSNYVCGDILASPAVLKEIDKITSHIVAQALNVP